jgi:NAD(P)-dependent dehydrogenase (short-subunit alcohol dehydrogenase family)
VRWGKRGARVNTISPGIVITPLAHDEQLSGPRGTGYRRMISCVRRVAQAHLMRLENVAALLIGPDGAFITGSDFLMADGVTAAYWHGDLDADAR